MERDNDSPMNDPQPPSTNLPAQPENSTTEWDNLYAIMPLSVWFKAENTLFVLEISRWVPESSYMSRLHQAISSFQLTTPTGSNVEHSNVAGASAENPIVLQNVTKAEMDTFVEYISIKRTWLNATAASTQQIARDDVMQCIKIARLWGLTSVESNLLLKLDLLKQTPAFQLYAALKFQDQSDIARVIRKLIYTPLNESDDLGLLPHKVYRQLTLARDAIVIQRSSIAALFPMIMRIDHGIPDHQRCILSCYDLWRTHIAEPLLGSQATTLSCRDTLIKALDKSVIINKACAKHMQGDLLGNSDWKDTWNQEGIILNGSLDVIMAAFNQDEDEISFT
ncbi:hypothetical protein CVT24_008266 [Panaeolus cyanescens]|uniref:Uncharacterized protein n=1 Tax=Panaeolus cyanescens TaxID=181874 RepID=A0A409W0F7_9AGAR|nr:hypothetical protein CVT24_008266 [Panaeolus cyanescens]